MVRAIRGATTVKKNDTDEIVSSTLELLQIMTERNGIEKDDIVSIIFTVTKDLDAAFPAAAARKIGWTEIALLCSYEIDVPGSLEKCIRVLMHFVTEKNNKDLKHVYLKEASDLRPDISNKNV